MSALPTHGSILYVDDDDDDRYFLKLSLVENSKETELVCASDGEKAIDYLEQLEPKDYPYLIVLDMNMPKWDGVRTIHYLKTHPPLSSIPVVVLSTSSNTLEREQMIEMGARSWLVKPLKFSGYHEIVRRLVSFKK